MIRHIVLIRFRSDVEAVEIEAAFREVVGLQEKIDGIVAVTAGSNVSPESLEKGFKHGFVVDFTDAATRDAYLPHPDHVLVGAKLVEFAENGIEGILVFDYSF